jgi:hypothetical protein
MGISGTSAKPISGRVVCKVRAISKGEAAELNESGRTKRKHAKALKVLAETQASMKGQWWSKPGLGGDGQSVERSGRAERRQLTDRLHNPGNAESEAISKLRHSHPQSSARVDHLAYIRRSGARDVSENEFRR